MDYVVGGVAALISGNVTPNRPKLLKRAFTPTKHPPSPNVTPKSELVDDRSIFLSPTMQKKKAIVKKSPKRIFQSTDMDVTMDDDDSNCVPSPKADKVKKHLKDDLESSMELSKAGQKKGKSKRNKSATHTESESNDGHDNNDIIAEPKAKKNKKQRKSVSETRLAENLSSEKETEVKPPEPVKDSKSAKKKNSKRNKSEANEEVKEVSTESTEKPIKVSKAKMRRERMKKMKLRHLKKAEKEAKSKLEADLKNIQEFIQDDNDTPALKAKKSKKSVSEVPDVATEQEDQITEEPQLDKETDGSDDDSDDSDEETPETVNPNAITDKDSDSEHESDNDIESEDDEENKKVLAPDADEHNSSDEDEEDEKKTVKGKDKESKKSQAKTDNSKPEKPETTGPTAEELKRTIFVGNVPFSSKCKKEIKKIFTKYGEIETVRIRTVPVADARVTPKLAIIKNELHPERTTVNVYVKFVDEAAVETALNENNTKLNHHHLRVTRSDSTGAEHDPRRAVFVGNVPFGLEDEGLRSRFERCGEIESVRIVRDKKTNAGKGFGYVNFVSKDGVELALALSEEDLTIKNRIMRVSRCQQNPTKKKPQTAPNRGPPSQRGAFSQNRGPPGNNRGSFGQNRGPPGQDRGSFGQNRGPPGQNRGPPGQNRGPPGQNRGRPGQRGSFGQNRGPPGQNRGSFSQNRGSFNQNRGPPGQNSGPPANRGGFSQNRGQDRSSFGQNRGAQGNWQNRGPPGGREAGGSEEPAQGAMRRVMNKRKSTDGGDEGPAGKKANVPDNRPKEKKQKQEFVGMTAEKKKKTKFSKDDKKKKALSEILMKK